MVSQILGMFRFAFQYVQNWLAMIFHSTGMLGVYLGALVIWLASRFLISPLLYVGSSDLAHHNLRAGKRGAKNFYRNHVTNRTPTKERLMRMKH